MSGKVILDNNGDREPDYWITDMAPNGTFVKIAEVLNYDLDKRVSLAGSADTYCFTCALMCRCIHRCNKRLQTFDRKPKTRFNVFILFLFLSR